MGLRIYKIFWSGWQSLINDDFHNFISQRKIFTKNYHHMCVEQLVEGILRKCCKRSKIHIVERQTVAMMEVVTLISEKGPCPQQPNISNSDATTIVGCLSHQSLRGLKCLNWTACNVFFRFESWTQFKMPLSFTATTTSSTRESAKSTCPFWKCCR